MCIATSATSLPRVPPLGSIASPLIIQGVLFTLGLVDLSVDLHGDATLLTAWYGAQDSLAVFRNVQRVVPVLLVMLLVKLCLKTIPGALAGRPGDAVGCAPLAMLPIVIFVTLQAKQLITVTDFGPDDLATLTRLHATRSICTVVLISTSIADYKFKLQAAVGELAPKKSEKKSE